MNHYTIKPLDTVTCLRALAERHNGVWNGCCARGSIQARAEKGQSQAGNRAYKERLVGAGEAHAALVFHGDIAVAWCEYGSPEELPSVYHLKEYTAGLERLPDYRITCSFVDKGYRRKGSQQWRCMEPWT